QGMSMNITSSSVLIVGFLLSSAGCGGNTLDGGSSETASSIEMESTGEFTPARVAAAKAACNAEHGPVDPSPTHADVEQRIVGAWYLCSEPNEYYLTKSLEFKADGTLVVLEPDGAGGLKRAQGLGKEASWKLTDELSNWTESGMWPEFETAPRRLRTTIGTWGFQNWYVPL
ncbi:MAG TPA: hypothetical protein VM925_35995, partial [Labilithrix sp.]|nr:hypothetical protein [Labilithrix sp.]